jgi:hypothetical protein
MDVGAVATRDVSIARYLALHNSCPRLSGHSRQNHPPSTNEILFAKAGIHEILKEKRQGIEKAIQVDLE